MSISPARLTRRGLQTASLLFALALLAGCRPGGPIDVKYNGFTLQPSRPVTKAGDVVFNINNKDGQVLHELVVLQTDVPADRLPVGADSKVDETNLNIVGRAEKIEVGQSSVLTVHLLPGHYVLLCNIVGHYQLGMHADFIVHP